MYSYDTNFGHVAHYKPGVLKLLNPMAEFMTAWSLEGRMQSNLCNLCKNRLLNVLQHKNNHKITSHVQNVWLAGLNWSASPMRPAGRSLATPPKPQAKP